MAIILILIGYYFDYKLNPKLFVSDLKGGLFIVSVIFISGLIEMFVLKIDLFLMILLIGIKIILIFTLKGYIKRG